MQLEDKGSVVISGASTGIGRACALRLDQAGYRVFAGVRRSEDGDRLCREASERLRPLFVDITDAQQIENAVKEVAQTLAPSSSLRALINNAGIGLGGPLALTPLEEVREQLETNVIGHIAMTRSFLPLLRGGSGRVVNIGSAIMAVSPPFVGVYAATKAALQCITDSMRRELAVWQIPVCLILPGFVDTPILEKYALQADRLQRDASDSTQSLMEAFARARKWMDGAKKHAQPPEAVAKIVLSAVDAKRPSPRYVVGMDARIALLARFVPTSVLDGIIRTVLK